MLSELMVRNLGVIEALTLQFGPGMTVLTGETGAGKTLVVEAIDLLIGGRPDSALVRPGAHEAVVEGRFVGAGGEEVVLCRVVPSRGRSRGYVDGRMATAATLADIGRDLVDLHGQHAHQSLLVPAVQRHALDRFAGAEGALEALAQARARQNEIQRSLADLGGDAGARLREMDLLRFQVAELTAAGLRGPDEDAMLEAEEARLADADAHREAGAAAYQALQGDGGTLDSLGQAVGWIARRPPWAEVADRLRAAAADLADVVGDVRSITEGLVCDPDRLAEIRARRQLLRDLQRKYGRSYEEISAFEIQARARLREIEDYEDRAAELEAQAAEAQARVRKCEGELGSVRRRAAPALGAAIEGHLRTLALPRARFEVRVGAEDPGDDVTFGLGANPGEPVLALTKVASGGELARTMLAARLVLSGGPPTLVFDEVDAGIGGQAASAVGHALAALVGPKASVARQVLVVTHLAQVAACADAHIAVNKVERDGRTVAQARPVAGSERVVELSRMLSGRPESSSARRHAAELLGQASEASGS